MSILPQKFHTIDALKLMKPDIRVVIWEDIPFKDFTYDLQYGTQYIKYHELETFRTTVEKIKQASIDAQTLFDNNLKIEENKDFLAEYDYKVIKYSEMPDKYPLDKQLMIDRDTTRELINKLQAENTAILAKYGQ